MGKEALKGTRPTETANTEYKALVYLIRRMIFDTVNTAIPVRVDSVEPGGAGAAAGYVSAVPLIKVTDTFGNTFDDAEIPKLPYFRIQGGRAALIIDPEPGDVGLAVFSQKDSSALARGETAPEPRAPGSSRRFSFADGFYLGGFLNAEPEVWLELKGDSAVLRAPGKITVETGDAEITASGRAVLTCAEAAVKAEGKAEVTASEASVKCGRVTVNSGSAELTCSGNVSVEAASAEINSAGDVSIKSASVFSVKAPAISFEGAATFTGAVTASDVVAGGAGKPVSLSAHAHGVAGSVTTVPL